MSEHILDTYAMAYVKLVLALGLHEDGYVDAYYGEARFVQAVEQDKASLSDIAMNAESLAEKISLVDINAQDEMLLLRKEFLFKQTRSVAARAKMNGGQILSFDDESQALYDTQAPHYDEAHFLSLVAQLRKQFVGAEPLIQQYFRFKEQFIIPKDRLDQVFQAAISEARLRTKKYASLSANEEFTLEYVSDKIWSGYNWYQGNYRSLIQINTDLPIYIDRAIDLAAHEGYPGHHVYNSLLEKELYRGRGWLEFSVYPLFSPQSVIAEGTANYGIEVVFPLNERIAFERDELFPLAGIDSALVEPYYCIQSLLHQLNYANNEVGRRYFSGEFSKEEAVQWLQDYLLYERARAEQRLKFIEANRSYVINYNWGQDLVKTYIEHHTKDANKQETQWAVFLALLSSPRLPSGLLIADC